MTKEFTNVYEDRDRARAYADLEYPGTYYLAFRDIPRLLARHVTGTRALDFGDPLPARSVRVGVRARRVSVGDLRGGLMLRC